MRQCFHLRTAKGYVSVLTCSCGRAWVMDLRSVQPRGVSAGDGELPLAPDLTVVRFYISHLPGFSWSQTLAKQCDLPAYKSLHLLSHLLLHLRAASSHLDPKSPYVRKQGNVAAFHVSVTPGCCPASPLPLTHPAAFTPAAYLPVLLCQVRPCMHNLVACPQKYLFGSPEAVPGLPSKTKQLGCWKEKSC